MSKAEKLLKYENLNVLTNWDSLVELSRERVLEIQDEWNEVKSKNEKIYSENQKKKGEKIQKISSELESAGVEIWKYKKKGFFKEKNGYVAWFNKNVIEVLNKEYGLFSPSSVGLPNERMLKGKTVKVYNCHTLVDLYDKLQAIVKIKEREERESNKLLVASIKFAVENDVNIEGLSDTEIVSQVRELAIEKFEKEEFPEGSEVYMKHGCYECSTYIVGSRRCECGNRRVYIEIEGDIVSGFYGYPECY